jgi:5-formyltetrahydrofolate cyclo-ligase
LIGIAFAFQEQPAICAQPWDVRLWAVVTERGTIPCHARLTAAR